MIASTAIGQTLSIKPRPVNRAIVVGVSDYEEIADLKFAHRDAAAFAKFLQAETSWKVEPENLQLLINEEATMPRFHKAMKWLVAESKPKDRAIIYFSGHGDVEESVGGRLGYLLLHNSPPVDYPLGGACPVEYLDAMVSTLSDDRQSEVILITDACRSGKLAGFDNGGPRKTNEAIQNRFNKVIKMMSCAEDQYSIEDESWGGGRGLFSYHLVNGLTGLADEDEDEEIYLYELSDYVRSRVRKESRQRETLQNPILCCDEEAKLNSIDKDQLFALNAELSMNEGGAVGMVAGRKDGKQRRPDSTLQQVLTDFQAALDRGQLMFPAEGAALTQLQRIEQFPDADSLYALASADLVVALQEDAQDALNSYLSTPSQELAKRWADTSTYQHYPDYLYQAATLLGEEDYFHNQTVATADYFKGVILRLQGERSNNKQLFEEALSIQKQALVRQPNTAHSLNEIGYLNLLLEQKTDAVTQFRAAHELAPSWVLPLNNLAEGLRRSGELEQAMQVALQAIALDSTFALSHNNLGLILFFSDRDDEAKLAYEKALSLDPDHAPAHFNLGHWHRYYRNFQEGADYFNTFLQLQPQDADGYADLAQLYVMWKKYDEARPLFIKALELAPDHAIALYNFANLTLKQGEITQAIDLFLQYKAMEPKDPDVYFALTCAYSLGGNLTEAMSNLKHLLEDLEYRDYDKLQADTDLEALRELPEYKALIKRYFPDK